MKETLKNIKRTYSYAKSHKKNMNLFLIGSVLIVGVGIISPIFSSYQLVYLTEGIWKQTIYAALALFITEIIRNLLTLMMKLNSYRFFRKSLSSIQTNLAKEILKLDINALDKHSSGLFIQRLTNDTSSLSSTFNNIIYNLSSVITDIGIFIAIFIISKWIFLYYVVIFIILLLVQNARTTKYNKKDKIYREQREKTAGLTGELVRGVRDIKMLNAEGSFMKEIENNIDDLNEKSYQMSQIDNIYNLFIGSIRDIHGLLLIILLIFLITNNNLSLALAIVSFSYRHYISNLVFNFGYLMGGIKEFNLSANRVFSIFDDNKKFKKEKFGNKHLDKVEGQFEFKKVSFEYNEGQNVLESLSFKIKANETVAFVGKSGAGKTTIFNLLCKMHDINTGEILIDDVNINELDKDSIRGNITVISQNPYIFNMSIKDNLKLVKESITEYEMIEACKMAYLHDFIETLPEKYDTVVGESGITLSGGQRQRLAIARAFVQKTKIILFDEATSALDNETQEHIKKAIKNMQKDYTILIIAHRLSTVVNCDRILFLEEGKIIAEGTHQELMKTNKDYKLLYETELIG